MVIGIDVSRANTTTRTGVEQYTWHLVQALKAVAASTPVVLYSNTPPGDAWGVFPASWQWKTLTMPGKRFWTQLRLSAELFINPPDVFFAPSSGLPILTPARTIATVHDVAFLTFPRLYSPFERRIQRCYLNRIVAQANTIIVPTQATKSVLLRWYPHCKRSVVVVSHGAPTRRSSAGTLKVPQSILFVGRIEQKKNIPALIHAVESLAHNDGYSQCILRLVGKPGYGFSGIAPLLRQCPKHIQYQGWLSDGDLERVQAQSQIVAFPSWEEGFGFPILEAWQAGSIPVISPAPALQEVGGTAVVQCRGWDSASIAEGLRRVIDHPEQIPEWQGKGSAALKQFDWMQCATTTFEILSGTYRYANEPGRGALA